MTKQDAVTMKIDCNCGTVTFGTVRPEARQKDSRALYRAYRGQHPTCDLSLAIITWAQPAASPS